MLAIHKIIADQSNGRSYRVRSYEKRFKFTARWYAKHLTNKRFGYICGGVLSMLEIHVTWDAHENVPVCIISVVDDLELGGIIAELSFHIEVMQAGRYELQLRREQNKIIGSGNDAAQVLVHLWNADYIDEKTCDKYVQEIIKLREELPINKSISSHSNYPCFQSAPSSNSVKCDAEEPVVTILRPA